MNGSYDCAETVRGRARGGGGAGPADSPGVAKGGISDALQHLGKLGHALMEAAGQLEERLGPVLRNEPGAQGAAGVNGARPAGESPFAGVISEDADRLMAVLDHLRSIGRRLDL